MHFIFEKAKLWFFYQFKCFFDLPLSCWLGLGFGAVGGLWGGGGGGEGGADRIPTSPPCKATPENQSSVDSAQTRSADDICIWRQVEDQVDPLHHALHKNERHVPPLPVLPVCSTCQLIAMCTQS